MEKAVRYKAVRYAAILCGGSGQRAGLGFNKALFCIDGKTLLELSLEKFDDFDNIVIAAAESDFEAVKAIAAKYNADVVLAGETRTESARAALNHLHKIAQDGAIVAIHDAARPFVSREVIERSIKSAVKYGSGVAAVKVTDSLKRAENMVVAESVARENMYAMQTPQTFRLSEIHSAYSKIDAAFTDDGEVYQKAGYNLRLVEGEYSNKKMTTEDDFSEYMRLSRQFFQKIGMGFDVHELVKKRRLILGGIEIPYKKGLLGHSDADVLLHAISDAVLSAAGTGDIGTLFPDTDAKHKNLDSAVILRAANEKLAESNQRIEYISAVIIAQKPKIAPYINEIRKRIAEILNIEMQKVNVSATTTEFLGIVGRGRAIAAQAICLCTKTN